MDSSVDETLRSVSYSVAKSRVLEKLVGMGAEVVDGPVANRTKPSRVSRHLKPGCVGASGGRQEGAVVWCCFQR